MRSDDARGRVALFADGVSNRADLGACDSASGADGQLPFGLSLGTALLAGLDVSAALHRQNGIWGSAKTL